jgi:hypothetical protein
MGKKDILVLRLNILLVALHFRFVQARELPLCGQTEANFV